MASINLFILFLKINRRKKEMIIGVPEMENGVNIKEQIRICNIN